MKSHHIAGLDIVRTIAILAVVIAHSSEFLLRLANVPHIGGAIRSTVEFVQPFGQFGVELFFVLSGFLIGNILIRTFDSPVNFSFRQVRHFWVRRWFRTLPLYWLILTVDIVLYYFLDLKSHEMPKGLFYLFLQNLWYPHPQYFFGEAWSLSIEEWFYLTLPVAMYICTVLARPVNKPRFLFRVFTGYLLVFVAIRIVNAFHPLNGPDQDAGIRKVVLFRLDAVMYGVLMAWFSYYYGQVMNRIKNYLLIADVAGIVFVFYLLRGPSVRMTAPENETFRFASDAFLYVALPLFFSFCLPFANSIKTLSSRRFSGFFTHISKISYSMYLVHYSLIFIPFFYNYQNSSPLIIVGLYILYWVIVIGLSSLLYKYFETSILRLRDRFANEK